MTRTCDFCGADIGEKRADARYCGKPCLMKASYDLRTYGAIRRHSRPAQQGPAPGDRECESCKIDISHKRSNARFCSRTCKARASEARRWQEGGIPEHLEMELVCEWCGTRFVAASRRFCSPQCVGRQRYARDGAKMAADMRVHYAANAEAKRAYSREWRRNNPHRRRTQSDARADLIELHPDFRPFEDREWVRLLRRFRHACAYCGAKGVPLHKDHVVPLSRGGRHAIANILPACQPCNSSKFNYFLAEWRLLRRKTLIAQT